MSRKAALFSQADIARVIRAARQSGAPEVEIHLGQTRVVIRLTSSTGEQNTLEQSPEIVL
jgi:hypothetical protein